MQEIGIVSKIVLTPGDEFSANNYAEMINSALKTNFPSGYRYASAPLCDRGMPKYIAWFVYLNKEWHSDWCNYIEYDKVYEICRSKIKFTMNRTIGERRLVFERISGGACKFVGVAILDEINDDTMTKTYFLFRASVVLKYN